MKRRTWTYIAVLLSLLCIEGTAQISIAEVRDKPDELFAYAGGLYRRGFYDMALSEYRRFIEANPNDKRASDALYYVVFCLKQLKRDKDMLKVIAEFRQKHSEDARSDELGMLASEAMLANGDEWEALELLAGLCSSKNVALSEYAKFNVAVLLLKNGKNSEAEALLKPLANAEFEQSLPYRAYAAMEYAKCLDRQNLRELALTYARKVSVSKHTPEQLAEEAAFTIGELLMKLNKKKEALEAFENCIARFPKGAHARWCFIYRIHIAMGNEQYAKTLELIADLREKYPDENNYEIDYLQAFALMECKRYNEALPFFQRITSDTKAGQDIRMNSQYYSIYCMLQSHSFDEAAAQSMNFAKSYPRTSLLGDVLVFGSQALLKIGRLDEAEAQCRKAMALFANQPDKLNNSFELLMSILEKAGKLQAAAEELFSHAANSTGEEQSLFYLRAGRIAQRAQNSNFARQAYEKSASTTKNNDTKYTALASLLQLQLENNQYQEALNTLALLKPICSKDKMPDLLFNEANVLFCAGRNQQAKAVLKEILDTYGSSSARRQKAQFMLASMLMLEENDKEAMPILEDFLWKKHEDTDSQLTFQFLDAAGQTYARQAMHDKARAAWRKILSLKNCTPEQINSARLAVARNLIETRNDTKEAHNILDTLRIEGEKGAELDMGEVLSLMAESEMLLGKPEMAMSHAERALKTSSTGSRSNARALYVLAYISLEIEKNAEKTNRFATQCYILTDDKEYSPRAMALSAEAFKLMDKAKQADEVMRELSQKYPLWLAAHPELKNKKKTENKSRGANL